FARLTDKEREAMLLVAFEDLDHAEAGRRAGVTPETFTVRVSRARKKLRVALGGALVVPLLVLGAIALSPSSHQTLLGRGFGADGSEILYWRIENVSPGMAPYTEELWMHVTPSGTIDKVRRLEVAGTNKGDEIVWDEPKGIANPWPGDITLKERTPGWGT